ncbi:MAG TPA: SdpI family protein [Candidatus Merdivicinus excrementipullorum]|uniref:SdpI family protein n=1 Tax=Candidatus Merdivicinus excrementipullorum TaxID=2840867 RepID=A0A9D1FPG3_9FIRM|nr:SdpI family protein [Candidatus Merdivicinus excrementipullorum]
MKRGFSIASVCYWILAVLPLLLTAAVYPAYPDVIPVHYNIEGVVDRYGGKIELFILPLIVLTLGPVFWILTSLAKKSIGPEKLSREEQKARNQKAISISRLVFLGVFNVLTIFFLVTAWKDSQADSGKMTLDALRLTAALLGVMDILLGNILPKCRQNSMMGVRTPWTLESEEVWYKTHRLGGFLMVGGGVLSLVFCLFLPGMWALGAYLAVTVLAAVVLTIASWRFSKTCGRD